MAKKNHLDVTVDEGKYRFIQEKVGQPIVVHRYGEPWLFDLLDDRPGANAIMAALFELEALKQS